MSFQAETRASEVFSPETHRTASEPDPGSGGAFTLLAAAYWFRPARSEIPKQRPDLAFSGVARFASDRLQTLEDRGSGVVHSTAARNRFRGGCIHHGVA